MQDLSPEDQLKAFEFILTLQGCASGLQGA